MSRGCCPLSELGSRLLPERSWASLLPRPGLSLLFPKIGKELGCPVFADPEEA